MNDNLIQKIQEINDYVVKEYSYDPHFDFDIVDELIIYAANLGKMGIIDLKLIEAIGYFYTVTIIASGKTLTPEQFMEAQQRLLLPISDASNEWNRNNPGKQFTIKNMDSKYIPNGGLVS